MSKFQTLQRCVSPVLASGSWAVPRRAAMNALGLFGFWVLFALVVALVGVVLLTIGAGILTLL